MRLASRQSRNVICISPACQLVSVRELCETCGFTWETALGWLDMLDVATVEMSDGPYFLLLGLEIALLGHLLPGSKTDWSDTSAKAMTATAAKMANSQSHGHGAKALRSLYKDGVLSADKAAQLLCIAGAYYEGTSLLEMRERLRRFGTSLCNYALKLSGRAKAKKPVPSSVDQSKLASDWKQIKHGC